MASDKIIADSVAKIIDKPYYLGDESKGLDCLNSLKNFYEDCGIPFPREFRDWSEANYREKWMEDVEIGRRTFVDFLQGLGTRIEKNYAVRGDLLIMRMEPLKPPSKAIPLLKKILGQNPFMKKFIYNVIAGKQLLTFPAVYLGNGHIFMIFETGVRTMPYKFFEKYVVEVRRLMK